MPVSREGGVNVRTGRRALAQRQMLKAFVRAVLAGSLAGAGLPLVLTVLIAVASLPDGGIHGPGSIEQTLWLAILPLLIAFPVVFVASVVVGLPVALLLGRTGRQSMTAYCLIGGGAGFVIPLIALLFVGAPAGYWIALLGLLGGTVTGYVWSRGVLPTPPPGT